MDPVDVAAAYFDNWKARDFSSWRSLLADDVTFEGALGPANGAEECTTSIQGMSQIMTDVVVKKRWVDGPDVLTWFELHTSIAEPKQVVNWSHVENGKITKILVTFDPTGLR